MIGKQGIMISRCFASAVEGKMLSWSFASAVEGKELLLRNDAYYNRLNRNDISYRLQKKDGTVEKLKLYAASQVKEFTEEEKGLVNETVEWFLLTCKEDGYNIPPMGEIVFIRSTLFDEFGASGYSTGMQIYLGDELFFRLKGDDEQAKIKFKHTLIHEIFHCMTRSNPDFRAAMYSIIKFKVEEKEYEFPEEISSCILHNPDVESINSYAAFVVNGKKEECVMICMCPPYDKEGEGLSEISIGFVPVDDLTTLYSLNDIPDFWDVVGRNNDYILDPEEIMAKNFADAMVYGMDGRSYPNPEIIQAVLDYLRK